MVLSSFGSGLKRAAAVALGVSAAFASVGAWAEELTITASAVGGGSLDATSKTVERGGTVSFTATADSGKELYAWFGAPGNCGTRLKTTIIISNVTENLSLTARFGTPYYVEDCNAASDAAGYGASADKPFRTPVYAAQNAPEYAICHLKGTMKPATTIVLNRPVRLSGEGTGLTTIGGTAIAAEVRLFEISHDEAVFDNVKFDSFTSTHTKYNEHLPGAMGWISRGLLSDALVTNCTLYQYHNDGAVANTGGHVVRLEVVACKQTSSATGVNSLPFYQNAGYTYDCTFRDTDTIVPGGNVRIDGGTMDHCRIVANGIKNFGASANFNPAGGVYITGGTLMNSLIKDNAAENAVAGLYATGKSVVSNCTFVGNITYSDDSGDSNGRSAIVTGNNQPHISRCVIWQNGVPTMPYSQVNVHAGTMSDCVLTADPLFVDAANGDYRLKIGSPAIALGAGCEPYAADHSALRCGFGVATNDVPAGGGSVVTAMVEGAGGNAVAYAWYLDDAATPFATTPEATLSNLAAGYHKVKLAVTAGGKTVECERARAINVHPFVAYVSNGGSATYPYDTEGKATPSFTDAFCALWQGPNATSDLYVAEGSYPMKASHVMTSAVRVHGAGRDLTGLDGQHKKVGNFRAFRMQHAGALIENLTVSNIYFYGYHKSGSGGGVKMSAGTVRNCRFYQCELEAAYQYAAGVYMTGGLVADCDFVDSFLKWAYEARGSSLYQGGGFVTNCVFRNHNRKMTNNGIASMAYVEAGTMDACQIVGNGCNDWALPCVGLYVNGGTVRNTLVAANTNNTDNAGVYVKKGTLEFSTVVGNVTRADTDGRSGIQVEGGTVRNCIIHSNGPVGSSAGSLCLSGGTFVTNLIDKANARAVDCLVTIPGFADAAAGDYRLKLGSAAIDAASPTDLDHDLAGNVRPNGKACDLGAYEYAAGASGFICSISISQSEWPSGASPEAAATVEGAPGAVTYAWYADGGTEPISTEENLVWAGATNGKHALRLVVTSVGKSVTNDVAEAFDVRPLHTYAGPNGSNEYPYDTEGKAAQTLNDAFNALWNDAATPVCVHVLEGKVQLTDTVTLGRKVSIAGAGRDKSVIDGGGRGSQGFVVNHDGALIEGVCISNVCYNFQSDTANGAGVAVNAGAVCSCRITHCWTVGAYQSGAGAYVKSGVLADSEIDNCWLDWSYDSYGCGVYQTGGVVTNCWIHHNPTPCQRGGSGVGVHGGLMTHCLITDNGTTLATLAQRAPQDGSGAYVDGTGILRNCIIRDNLNSTKCAGVVLRGDFSGGKVGTVEHCTIYNNNATTSSIGNSGLVQEGGTVVNTIVYGNGEKYSSVGSVTLTGGTFATNLIDVANARAVDCVIANPSFVNVATNDFRLKLGSPAIDKGCVREGCETDYAGTARDEKPDLGAYEYVSTGGPLAAGISISQTDYPTGSSPTAEATAEGEDLTDLSYAWYVDGGETAASTERTFVWQDAPTGRHALRLVVKNGGGETSEVRSDNAFDIHPFVTYASTNGASIYPYDAPEKAATNVNDALNAIWSQETESARRVNVAEGTYGLTDTLSLGFAVSVVGAGRNRTIFDASGLAKRALAVLDDNAGASGFEIRGLRNSQITTGNAVYQAGGTIRDIVVNDVKTPVHSVQGIGVAVTGGVFEDSIITNCEASNTHNTFGVALYLSGGTVRNCEIVGNRKTGVFHATDYSVAAYVAGGVLENSRLVGNTSSNRRAGAYMTGGTIRNCLFAENVGVLEGDALYVPDDASDGIEIVNCTFAANGTSGKTAVYMGKGKLSNSIVFGNVGAGLAKSDMVQVYNSCWPENASTHDGNLVGANPRFRRPERGDWRLTGASPCVNAGDWTVLGATKDEVRAQRDLWGASRLSGANVDMGCYETHASGFLLLVR